MLRRAASSDQFITPSKYVDSMETKEAPESRGRAKGMSLLRPVRKTTKGRGCRVQPA